MHAPCVLEVRYTNGTLLSLLRFKKKMRAWGISNCHLVSHAHPVLAVLTARDTKPVILAPSKTGAGIGAFARRDHKAGSTVLTLRGVERDRGGLEKLMSQEKLARIYKYSLCDDRTCAVPLHRDGNVASYPCEHSGHRVNEAYMRDGVDYPPNLEFGTLGNAPSIQGHIDVPLVATRDIRRGKELLTCYGNKYSARDGYTVSPSCKN